jgi:5-methylcytosine-specific restriction endonuclease McrA
MVKHRQNHRNLGEYPIKYDSEGRKICQICSKILTGRMTKYCSNDCSHEMMVRNDHNSMKEEILKLRGWKCEKCKKETSRFDLILDHKIPIALGGEEFSKENVWLLCKECNKIKTAQDSKDIAKLRAEEKLLQSGQKLLVSTI